MLIIDILIVMTLALYGIFGYRRGFVVQIVELLGFVLSFAVALLIYQPVGKLIARGTGLAAGLAGLIAFLLLWLGLELVFGLVWKRLRHRIPGDIHAKQINRLGGIAPALLKGLLLVVVVLLIVATAPLPSGAKQSVTGSALAKPLLSLGTAWQQQFNQLFGDALKDTLAFKTIKTGSDDTVQLGFTVAGAKDCGGDEMEMLDLVNRERRKVGLGTVQLDAELRSVGRVHSRDMLARGYFAHVNPDRKDPFDRMEAAGITYQTAGENLAFAPTVDVAHTGLMNSPGHRANILRPEFTKLGIGCADGGVRGLMFSQEFKG